MNGPAKILSISQIDGSRILLKGRLKIVAKIISCACRCGQTLLDHNKWGRPVRYIRGHNWRGKYLSEQHKQSLRGFRLAKVGNGGLHKRIGNILPKPLACEFCDKETIHLDKACVSGYYNIDLENWAWICRSCHFKHDFEMGFRKRIRGRRLPPGLKKCPYCDSDYIHKRGYDVHHKQIYQCMDCRKYFINIYDDRKKPRGILGKKCPRCGSDYIKKDGKYRGIKQIYQCMDCKRCFIEMQGNGE